MEAPIVDTSMGPRKGTGLGVISGRHFKGEWKWRKFPQQCQSSWAVVSLSGERSDVWV